MARKKPLNVYPVKNLEEVNEVLREIASLKRLVDAEETIMNDEIDAIKAKTEKSVESLQKKMQGFENGIHAFSELNKKKLFLKKRSIDLNFGVLGFRKATKLATMPKTTWKKVLELLESKGLKSGIRVKNSVNKDVLNEWPDEKLEKVNVKRKKTDDFWYEVKEENIPAMEPQK